MTNFPFISLFTFILMFGTIFSISSSHWFSVWLGLELTLIGFVPIMVQKGKSGETESGVKYFLIQSISSVFLLFGVLIMSWNFCTWEMNFLDSMAKSTLIFFGLFMKLGAAPFHFWIPSVVAGLSWNSNLILLTWQKITPLFMLSSFMNIHNFMLIFMLLAATLIGGVGGINQTSIRAILAYSSILHMGWILTSTTISLSYCGVYFLLYSLIMIFISSSLNFEESMNNKNFSNVFLWNSYSRNFMSFFLLSLGGIPPLLGFFGKWMILLKLLSASNLIPAAILVIGSMMTLYYYLTLSFSLILTNQKTISTMHFSPSMIKSMGVTINLMGFLVLFSLNSFL
uniref:NADH dehydrogenase subunit 2 n=1 Tax=Plaxiphora tricolor TaxID=2045497 RepID=UPI002E795802|nr:NADH dehydrogenase subunit 2 [Plaxiphora tricolor]WRI60255.1 NADH dehydrogenase subunit 2 [Plaxiphora tricolor]